MIGIPIQPCESPGCPKSSGYNYAGQKPKFCVQHKLPSMVNCITRRCCTEPGCVTPASFSSSREHKPVYCSRHRKQGMVHVQRTCRHDNCNAPARFNVAGTTRAHFCFEHKSSEMIRIRGCKKCEHENCGKWPCYNLPGMKQKRFCASHKTPGMINVGRPLCKMDGCTTYASNALYDGYCAFCFAYLFPDKPIARRFGTKERAVREFLKSAYPECDWVCDRRIGEGCSARRPDFLLDLGFQVLIVEVDENQHAMSYTEICENRRMMELSQDVGHRPLVIVRFNPDSYKNENGERVPSCWGVDPRTGTVHVVRKHKRAWDLRLASLQECVNYWMKTPTTKTVEVIQLFYSQNPDK